MRVSLFRNRVWIAFLLIALAYLALDFWRPDEWFIRAGIVIVAAVVYYFVILPVGGLLERFKPTPEAPAATIDCPQCLSKIPDKATVCAFCSREVSHTSDVQQSGVPAPR